MSKSSKRPPFEVVRHGKYAVKPCWSASKRVWYITVINTLTGNHLHFDYSVENFNKACMMARYAKKGGVPNYYSKMARLSVQYLIIGGDKPSRHNHNKD